ncbi:uncharacterized protein LOC131577712 [Poecile atricapillus]|uniref:uncharacterized protein LOC131577712 n=1 Tax=Poecile atricapillus TaxID=48891 RepID=UPI0027395A5A|nr:uncharacterized protein LOC131577712 [Poecile atricapillus]
MGCNKIKSFSLIAKQIFGTGFVQKDEEFLPQVFAQLTNEATPGEQRCELMKLLKEFCAFSFTLPEKKEFLETLAKVGFLPTLKVLMRMDDPQVRSAAMDILSYLVEFSPAMVREFVMQEARQSENDTHLLTEVIEQIICSPDTEFGGDHQSMKILCALIEPKKMLATASRSEIIEFLNIFYNRYIHVLTAPLLADTSEEWYEIDNYQTAEKLASVLRLLSFCVERHRHHMKIYIIKKNLLGRALLFQVCESAKNTKGLHLLFDIVRGILYLDKTILFEVLFSAECILNVVGCLEYDPCLAQPGWHRDFLTKMAKFQEVIPIRDPEVRKKIHQMSRAQYIQAIIAPNPSDFEEGFLSTLNSFISSRREEILHGLKKDEEFLPQVFAQLTNEATPGEQRCELMKLLKEFCAFSFTLPEKKEFLETLAKVGFLPTLKVLMGMDDPQVRSAAIDILSYLVEFSPAMVREFVMQEARQSENDTHLLTEVIEQIICSPDTEFGGNHQSMKILCALIEPKKMLATASRSEIIEFLNIFYNRYIHVLTAPLLADTSEEWYEIDNYQTAEKLASVLRLLSFCVERHRHHMKIYIIKKNLLGRALLFQVCESAKNTKGLHLLFDIVRGILYLDKTILFEVLFSAECILNVVGCLEYDPCLAQPGWHRDFLTKMAKFQEVIPIRDPEVRKKIHQMSRAQYIQAIIAPNPSDFEEGFLSTLNSFISSRREEILHGLKKDEEFLPQVFAQLTNEATPGEQRCELMKLLKEFCAFSFTLPEKKEFLETLAKVGFLPTLKVLMRMDDPQVRSAAIDILSYLVEFSPAMVREFVMQEARQSENDTHLLTEVIEQIICSPDTEFGGDHQSMKILCALIEPKKMLATASRSEIIEFLNIFYNRYIHVLTAPLLADTSEEWYEIDNYQTAEKLASVLRLLSFCVERHRHHMKIYIIKKNLLGRALVLLKCKHKFLALSALRFMRKIIGLKDDLYNRYITKRNLFEPVVNAVLDKRNRCNLLQSALLELFEFIRMQDIQLLIAHIVKNFSDALESVKYIPTLQGLKTKYEQEKERKNEKVTSVPSKLPDKTFVKETVVLPVTEDLQVSEGEEKAAPMSPPSSTGSCPTYTTLSPVVTSPKRGLFEVFAHPDDEDGTVLKKRARLDS